jgi:cell division septal protein FtsQ
MGKAKFRSRLLREATKKSRDLKREKHMGLYLALLFLVAFVLGMALWLFLVRYVKPMG